MRPLASTIILGPEGRPEVGVSYYGHQDEEDLEGSGSISDAGSAGGDAGEASGGDSGGDAGIDTMAAGNVGLAVQAIVGGEELSTNVFGAGETVRFLASGFTVGTLVTLQVWGPMGVPLLKHEMAQGLVGGAYYDFVLPTDIGHYRATAEGRSSNIPLIGMFLSDSADVEFDVVAKPPPRQAPPKKKSPFDLPDIDLKGLAILAVVAIALLTLGPAVASRVKQ